MTSEEMERAIDFLLKSGARADARIQQNAEQLAQLSTKVDQLSDKVDRISEKVDRISDDFAQLSTRQDSFADTQANIMQVMMQTFERQAEINKSLSKSIREGNEALRESLRERDEALRRQMHEENESLRKQMHEGNEALRAYIGDVAAAGAATDRRLDRLMEAVERLSESGR